MTTSTNKALSGKINRVKQVNKKTDEKALIKIGSNEFLTTNSGSDDIPKENQNSKKKSSFRVFMRRLYTFLLTACIF